MGRCLGGAGIRLLESNPSLGFVWFGMGRVSTVRKGKERKQNTRW